MRGMTVLAILIVPPIFIWFLPLDEVGWNVMGIFFWLFFMILVGILTVIDWFRSARPTGRAGSVVRHLLRIPIFLLGLSAFLIGIGALALLAYSLYWKRELEFWAPGAIGIFIAMIVFGTSLIRLSLGLNRRKDEAYSSDPGSVDSNLGA
jgi:hypothetical protein